jgi:uncharacterized protein YcbK (DUF882 family)
MPHFGSDMVRRSRNGRLSRRAFLKWGALAGAAAGLGPRAARAMPVPEGPERALAFYNTHTGESLKAVYWARGAYLPDGLAAISHILRDHRSGEARAMDVRLLELLHTIAAKLETRDPFHIISGYRSPATNAMLRERSVGVARHSMHMEGKAVDIRVPGHDVFGLRRLAAALHEGGVGCYPKSDFVHVDVGRVRFW